MTAGPAVETQVTIACPECPGKMVLRQGRYGHFYGCTNFPDCEVGHGAHPDGSPMGTPANRITRQARVRAHAAFDTLWQGGGMKRKDAYRWMQSAMEMTPADAHIARFDAAQCENLIQLIEARSGTD